jgi:hypothetical protein
MCEAEACDKPVNRDGLCLRHKLLKVNVATVPGGARDQRNGISRGVAREKGLNRYKELKDAGEQPSGTTLEAQRKDSYKKMLWEKHEQSLADENPTEKVTQVKKSLLNKT